MSTILVNGNSSTRKPLFFINILCTIGPKKNASKEVSQFVDVKVNDKRTFFKVEYCVKTTSRFFVMSLNLVIVQ